MVELLTIAVLAGCGTSGSAGPATSPTANSQVSTSAQPVAPQAGPPTPAPAPADFPVGTYTVTLSEAQTHGILVLTGVNVLVLRADGTYTISSLGEGTLAGVYYIAASRITFRETDGPGCAASNLPPYVQGVYSWSSDGPVLRFTLVADPCGGGFRATQVAAAPWTKS